MSTVDRKPPRYGTCSNCGAVCEWLVFATMAAPPHPLNPALAPEELEHRRKAAAIKAKATVAAKG